MQNRKKNNNKLKITSLITVNCHAIGIDIYQYVQDISVVLIGWN